MNRLLNGRLQLWVSLIAGLVLAGVGPAFAVSTTTNLGGTESTTIQDCLQGLPIQLFDGENCGYGPYADNQAAPFGEIVGPQTLGFHYSSTTAPFPWANAFGVQGDGTTGYTPVIGDGKIAPAVYGTVTVNDNGNGFGVDDLISFDLTWTDPLGGEIIRLYVGNSTITANSSTSVAERYTSMNQVLAPHGVSSATPNGFGGFDYVIGSRGFPGRISFLDADGAVDLNGDVTISANENMTACNGQLFGSVECGLGGLNINPGVVDPTAWNAGGGAGWVAHPAAAGLGSLEDNIGAITSGTLTALECVDPSDGPFGSDIDQTGGSAAKSNCDTSLYAFSPGLIGDCSLGILGSGHAEGTFTCIYLDQEVGIDNLLLKVSTDASGNVLSVKAFDVQETEFSGPTPSSNECGQMAADTSGPGSAGGTTIKPYCNSWMSGYFTLAPGSPDTTPDAFHFNDQTGVSLSSLQTSSIDISGINATTPMSVSGGSYSVDGGSFTSAPGLVHPSANITVRHTSAAGFSQVTNTTLTVGGVSDTFTSTTMTGPTVTATANNPSPAGGESFYVDLHADNMPAIIEATLLVSYDPARVTLNYVDGLASGPFNSGDGGTAVDSGPAGAKTAHFYNAAGYVCHPSAPSGFQATPCDFDAIRLYFTASPTVSGPAAITISDDGGAHCWAAAGFSCYTGFTYNQTSVTVNAGSDTTPDAFGSGFSNETSVPLSSLRQSSYVTITGINTTAPISVVGGAYYIANAGGWTTAPGVIANSDNVRVRHTSAGTGLTPVTTTLTIGGVQGSWTSTTLATDTTPDPFTFTAQTGMQWSSPITSNPVTIAGIDTATPISVTNGSYSINGGAFTSVPGAVGNGDSVRVRQTSANTGGATVYTTLTIGGVSATFSSTTLGFPTVVSVAGGLAYYDPVLNITWLADANHAMTSGYDADGLMTWAQAQAWIASLNGNAYLGVTSWRLPKVGPVNGVSMDSNPAYDGSTDYSFNVSAPGSAHPGATGSEMAHMFYTTLANTGGYDRFGILQACYGGGEPHCLVNTGPFANIQTRLYWSGTEFAPDANYAWNFGYSVGDQYFSDKTGGYFAWAVVDGNPLTDTTPNPFAFTAQTGVQWSSPTTSNSATITGINAAAPISVTNGSYSINAAAYTSVPGTVSNGDSVTIRHTSANTGGGSVYTILTVGSVSATFSSTTLLGYTTLVSVAGGAAYYDPVLDITWLADANLAATETFGVGGINVAGELNWPTAQSWIGAMNAANYLGVNNWRLPTIIDTGAPGCVVQVFTGTDCGYNVDLGTSEMAHLFYGTLGNTAGFNTSGLQQPCNPSSSCLTNSGPFSNLQPSIYWSGTEYSTDTSEAWIFVFADGGQTDNTKTNQYPYFAWPVVSGNPLGGALRPAPVVSSVSPNPVTGSTSSQTITIVGDHFVNKPTVTLTRFGQQGYVVPAAQVTYVDVNHVQMSITTGTTGDNWTVQVTNPDGQLSNAANFAVGQTPPPEISVVFPNPVTGSTSPQVITINGAHFVNKPTLTLKWTGQAGYPVPTGQVSFINNSQVQLLITTGTTDDDWYVRITNPDAQSSIYVGFHVSAPVTPSITSVFPDTLTGSANPQTITVNGNNFASSSTVSLTSSVGPPPAGQVTYVSPTELQVSLTTGTLAAGLTVRVNNPNGQSSNAALFTAIAPNPSGTDGKIPIYEVKPDLNVIRLYYGDVTPNSTGARTYIAAVPAGPNAQENPRDLKFSRRFRSWPFQDTFAYGLNFDTATISTFAVNPADGVLTQTGSAATGLGPKCMALDPGGDVANVVNSDGSLSKFGINRSTGALTSQGIVAANLSCPLGSTSASGLATPYVGNPFLFVLNPGDPQFGWRDSISVLRINRENGRLTPVPKSPFRISTSQSQRLRSSGVPSGTFIYVLGAADSAIAVISVNPLTGELKELKDGAFSISQSLPGTQPLDMALDPGGIFQYVVNGDSTVLGYRLDPSKGTLESLGTVLSAPPTNPALSSAAVDPGAHHVYVTDAANGTNGVIRAYDIDRGTGALTFVSNNANLATVAAGENPRSITVHPSGRFVYVLNQLQSDGSGAISTFRIDVTTGALTPVGTPVPTGKNPTAPITIHPNGRFAFTTNDQDATISAFQIDPATGGLTPVPGPPVPAGPTPYTVAIDSTGKFAYVANFGNPETISGYRIDQTTGALSPVDGNPFQSDFHSAPSRGPRAVIATVQ